LVDFFGLEIATIVTDAVVIGISDTLAIGIKYAAIRLIKVIIIHVMAVALYYRLALGLGEYWHSEVAEAAIDAGVSYCVHFHVVVFSG
jgi:hypothetical protein